MKLFLFGIVIGSLILFLLIALGAGSKADQPIPFNHKKHQEQGMTCDACHRFFQTQTFSGMPRIAICMECHKDPVTDSPEEEKIRQFQKKGKEIPWERLYQQPDHVFFSHRRHVVLGKTECKTCHGEMGQSEKPPSRPWIRMTMKWCMDCHAKSKVSNDCLTCHV
jgi:hypothetical protein